MPDSTALNPVASALDTDAPALNIVFAGTPDFAAAHLSALINSHHNVIGVYTQPDRPSGRGKKLTPSAVKQVALAAGINVYQPKSLKGEAEQAEFAALNADIMVVVAYGLILPKAILDTPKHGCLNVHGSILPRWRGAAPIQRAIEAGDTQTGITIMQMDVGLDTGDMLSKTYCDITLEDTAQTLHDKLQSLGPGALLETLKACALQQLAPVKQNDAEANYAAKLLKSEAAIDWTQSAMVIERTVRAFNPFPVCNSTLTYTDGSAVKVKIYRVHLADNTHNQPAGSIIYIDKKTLVVACGAGAVALNSVQVPGKKPVDIGAFINGFGTLLDTSCQFS